MAVSIVKYEVADFLVNRTQPFVFSEKIINEYGDFKIIEENPHSKLVNFFTTEDVEFINVPGKETLAGREILKLVLDEGYVPLDIYCARAILQDKEGLEVFIDKWREKYGWVRSPYSLDTLMFLGTILSYDQEYVVDCIPTFCFNHFHSRNEKMVFIPFEDEKGVWFENSDFIPVFTKKFMTGYKL